MGEDPPVKKRTTDNDYLADPEEVKDDVDEHDEIDEAYKWSRVGHGSAWDATLMVGGKLAYDKIAGPYLGTTPIDMTKYAIAAAGVAIVMNMAHEYLIKHKKYHKKAMEALKIARQKLQTDKKFKQQVETMAREKKLNEAFWDFKDKPYSPHYGKIAANVFSGSTMSALAYGLYQFVIEKETEFQELWDTKFFLIMAAVALAGGVSKDYIIRYGKKHVDAAKAMHISARNWKDSVEYRDDASKLIKSLAKSMFKGTKFVKDFTMYKDRQFEALERFKRKWYRENIKPEAPSIVPVKEEIRLHELFVKKAKPLKVKRIKPKKLTGAKLQKRQANVGRVVGIGNALFKAGRSGTGL